MSARHSLSILLHVHRTLALKLQIDGPRLTHLTFNPATVKEATALWEFQRFAGLTLFIHIFIWKKKKKKKVFNIYKFTWDNRPHKGLSQLCFFFFFNENLNLPPILNIHVSGFKKNMSTASTIRLWSWHPQVGNPPPCVQTFERGHKIA